jgi:hypothetical protein
MNRYAMVSAVALAAAFAAQAHAQAVVENPGYCAQYYPNSNCQNYGPGNPLYPGSHVPSGPAGNYPGVYASTAAPAVIVHHHRHRAYR